MKPGLAVGETYEYSVVVDDTMRAQLNHIVVHNLYATASMLTHMEWAARQHILPYLQAGEEGVGHHINIKHFNPTPVGATVRIRSTVTAVEPNRITSQVEAWNEQCKIGEGTLVQAIVSLEELKDRYADSNPPAAKTTASKNTQTQDDSTYRGSHGIVMRPAVLWSRDLSRSFSLSLKGFENKFPCSRYDEWFICEGQMNSPEQQYAHEGPFLLKFETEEIIQGLKRVHAGETNSYKPDLLEPILSLDAKSVANEQFELTITMKQPDPNKRKAEFEQLALTIDCDANALNQFYRALSDQLNTFDSNL